MNEKLKNQIELNVEEQLSEIEPNKEKKRKTTSKKTYDCKFYLYGN